MDEMRRPVRGSLPLVWILAAVFAVDAVKIVIEPLPKGKCLAIATRLKKSTKILRSLQIFRTPFLLFSENFRRRRRPVINGCETEKRTMETKERLFKPVAHRATRTAESKQNREPQLFFGVARRLPGFLQMSHGRLRFSFV